MFEQRDDARNGLTPAATAPLEFGCDYNPEQWSRDVWIEDMRLMREAGVTLVAINIFGWASLEPEQGRYDFEGLDAIIALLDENGIGINLGTGTSSAPPWLTTAHPEILPRAKDMTKRWPGGRQAWCPSSPVFREHAMALVTAVADRYGQHPALKLWHVSNELGCHNPHCYCDVSAAAFRVWLEAKYETIDALNTAWGTTFWSQRYSAWSDILPPRTTLSTTNPTQELDFNRFSSDEVLGYYLAEAEILRARSSAPVTTNFMVTAHIRSQNYWQWAPHMDVIANDHYLDHRLPHPEHELAFAADATRGLAQGGPWMLMEQATGAVNWQPRNVAKTPGELLRNTMTHVARGADGICFFQWRASSQGSEKFHSGMVPHAGTDSVKWREVVELGKIIGQLGEIAGSRVVAEVAFVFSWESWWATDLDSRPSHDVRYLEQVHRLYTALWQSGVTVDIVAPGADLSGYKLAVVPCLYLVTDAEADVLTEFTRSGGTTLITFFSGIVDEDDRVRLGGYPGAFRELLGITTEEFQPLHKHETRLLDDGRLGSVWSEVTRLDTASAVSTYADSWLAGRPAITANHFGDGVGWYLGTQLDESDLLAFVSRVLTGAGVDRPAVVGSMDAAVETITRRGVDHDYVFVINHSEAPVSLAIHGDELLHGQTVQSKLDVPAGEVRVIRTAPAAARATAAPATPASSVATRSALAPAATLIRSSSN